MKNDILIKRCKICYFNLQVKGRNKTHDLNTKPGLQFRSHTQELEHKLTEILSSLDSRSSSRDQELEFLSLTDWLLLLLWKEVFTQRVKNNVKMPKYPVLFNKEIR